jgi:hypothetical protein
MKTKMNLLEKFQQSRLSIDNMNKLRGGDTPPPPDGGAGEGGK